MHVSIFGDSILKGVVLENGRYVLAGEEQQRFFEEQGLETSGHCKFGATVDVGAKLLERSMAKNPLGDYTVIEFGGNDIDFNWAQIAQTPDGVHLCNTVPEQFEKTYVSMIQTVREAGSIPIATTLPPISATRYFDWISRGLDAKAILNWLGEVDIIYRCQEVYSRMIERIARQMDCLLLDLRAAFPTDKRELETYLCDDGIHPNRLGQALMYNQCRRLVAAL